MNDCADHVRTTRSDHFSPEAVLFLEQTVWGTKSLLYRSTKLASRLASLQDAVVFTAEKKGRIVAVVAFIRRKEQVQGQLECCHYLRFFSISPSLESKGSLRPLLHQVQAYIHDVTQEGQPVLCMVENSNQKSLRIALRQQFRPLRTIRCIGFSCFCPRKKVDLQKAVSELDKQLALRSLQQKYGHYEFVHYDGVFKGEGYYMSVKNGRMIAGVKVTKLAWAIEKFSGLSGNLLRYTLAHVPLLNRVIHHHFQFLAFDYLYFEEGKTQDLNDLLETVLAHLKIYSGLICADEKSSLFRELNAAKGMGLLYRLTRSTSSALYLHDESSLANKSDKMEAVFINADEII